MIHDIIKNIFLKERDIYNNLGFKAGFIFEMFTLKCTYRKKGLIKQLT